MIKQLLLFFPSLLFCFCSLGEGKKKELYASRYRKKIYYNKCIPFPFSTSMRREIPCESVICLKCCIQFFLRSLKVWARFVLCFFFIHSNCDRCVFCIDCCLQHLQLFCLNINDINSVANRQENNANRNITIKTEPIKLIAWTEHKTQPEWHENKNEVIIVRMEMFSFVGAIFVRPFTVMLWIDAVLWCAYDFAKLIKD